jgi:DNA invertase Pin-like site-specific DNA recombinase
MAKLSAEKRNEARLRLQAGAPINQIASEYGITYQGAWYLLRSERGYRPQGNQAGIPNEMREMIRHDYHKGKRHPQDIARQYGISSATVYLILEKKSRPKDRRFAPEVLAEITRMRMAGHTHQEIQDALGVTSGTVYRTLKKVGLTGDQKNHVRMPRTPYKIKESE